MDSQNATQERSEIESALSAIVPDLAQLLQSYQLSKILEIDIGGVFIMGCGCCFIGGKLRCEAFYGTPVMTPEDRLGLTLEKAEQLCKDVESKLSKVWASLSPSAQEFAKNFNYSLLIDPATADTEQKTVCKWLQNNILQCSNS
jgi:hypothetical protein